MNEQKLEKILQEKLPVFESGGLNCAETVLSVMCAYWDLDAPFVPRIATAFGGGLAATRGVCGALTGGLMAIGLRLGRDEGGDRKPAYSAGLAFIEWFEERNNATRQCGELIGLKRGCAVDSRSHGDAHERVCRPLVVASCRYLAENIE